MFTHHQTVILWISLSLMFWSKGVCEAEQAPLQVSQIHIKPTIIVNGGEIISLAVDASGTDLHFKWTSIRGEFTSSPEASAVLYMAPDSPGFDVVTVEVSDNTGANVIRNIIFQIEPLMIPTSTPFPISTPTPLPTATPTPLPTSTPTPLPTATPTPLPTSTPTPLPTATPTPLPTSTPTPLPTAIPTPLPTSTPTPPPTATPKPIPTPTEIPSPSPTSYEFRITKVVLTDTQGRTIEPVNSIYSFKVNEPVTIRIAFTNPSNHHIDVKWTATHGEISIISKKTTPNTAENLYIAEEPGADHVKVFLMDTNTNTQLQLPISITVTP